MDHLTGKTVLITGASRGIGASAAELFSQAGANVVLTARSGDALEEVRAGLRGEAVAQVCDVSRYDDVAAAVQTCVDRFGGIDVLINNAGAIVPIARMEEADPEGWGHAIDINLKGVFWGMRAALPHMLERGGGTVLTISSGAAHHPIEAWSHYCASKAGAAMLTEMLHAENGANGIRAMGLSPGTVATQMQREIKTSGINPVSQLDWSDHIPPDWPARTLMWMCSSAADAHCGQELSLRDPDLRSKVGLE
ncbi:SDR family oxidoreductase [Chachezhania antarctica]|uniref:SDR family oxidoreductase n=1 Tax=Chachezhania antarctica TaxID=2340860 RepID=UPI000EB1CE5F|nr:SDR family oxidoreductase [Chachezhania antarctica]